MNRVTAGNLLLGALAALLLLLFVRSRSAAEGFMTPTATKALFINSYSRYESQNSRGNAITRP